MARSFFSPFLMPTRIDIRCIVPDTRIGARQAAIGGTLTDRTKVLAIVDRYVIDSSLSINEQAAVVQALTNPLIEEVSVDASSVGSKADWVVEIGYLPGVTDNVGTTARETIEDLLHRPFRPGEAVYVSQLSFLSGRIDAEEAEKIAKNWYNPLIQYARCHKASAFRALSMKPSAIARVHLKEKVSVTDVDLEVGDEELRRIGKLGIRDKDGSRRGPLALPLLSLQTIRKHFRKLGRAPTDMELESIAQTWSEHCKHTIFASPIDGHEKGLYKTFIKGATEKIRKRKGKKDICVSVFSDNSGAIAFDDKYLVTHKVETHNSPSALDPFGGAITGILGVNRDALGFGMGAKPVANVYGFCVADPRDKSVLFRDAALTQPMLSAERIMTGVVAGVNAGGNCSGIPTPHGFLQFHERYRGKPLVFAGTVGLIPRKIGGKFSHEKRALPGDLIVMVGGRVGADGIHGATFSSEGIDASSPATAVQIGDPITQKKLGDSMLLARDLGLYRSVTDNGAGGLSCAVAEMAREAGGCEVKLEKVPPKYPGLVPWQIWISESQERMTFAVPMGKWKKFYDLFKKHGVEATVIGMFTSSGRCVVEYKGRKAMDLGLKFLHDGLPTTPLSTRPPSTPKRVALPSKKRSAGQDLLDLLKRPNIASTSFVTRQYDHEVQATSVIKPLQGRGQVNGDAAVIAPQLGSNHGIVLSSALYPTMTEIDAYAMAACCIDSAIRQSIATGADLDHLALLDNFCWCSSTDPERLYQLKRAAQACHDFAVAYGTPFISGKDSMFNDFSGFDGKGRSIKISIPPTLLISTLGVMKDVTKAVSLDLKMAGDHVYLLGETHEELGGSEFSAQLGIEAPDKVLGNIPLVDAKKNVAMYHKFSRAVQKGLVASAISVGSGGLGVALAKTAIGGELGLSMGLKGVKGNVRSESALLFGESQGRIVVSVAARSAKAFETSMKGSAYAKIGTVTKEARLAIKGENGKNLVDLPLRKMTTAYRSTFRKYE